ALAASGVPNTVTDEQFVEMQSHWDDGQIVEILAVIALYGFLNRWNDTLATQLETPSRTAAEKIVGPQGWQVDKHA
ncbi:MAG: carboxymuconolactone decarboxylase family protein, partial [Acidimicrobiia bacterium]|nr:carboxymuconolactone decarboxylase family protein [Acidimicrobiia bacterium]